MLPPSPLLETVLVPLFGAAFCYLLAGRLGSRVGWIALIFLGYVALVFFLAVLQFFGQGGALLETYQWAPSAGLAFGFLADGLSLPVALIISIVLAAGAAFSVPYMRRRITALLGTDVKGRHGLYFANFLLVSSGLLGITLSTNLIELYLFLELVLIPTFVIISLFGYVQKERVAIIYIIWNQLGAFIFLGGVLLLYAATGSFDISTQNLSAASTSGYAYWIVGLVLVGWLVKMAIFGVHMWLPITEAEPPTSFAPIMAVVSGIGTYVIVRVLIQGMPTVFQAFSLPLMAWAVVTMFYGGIVTLVQNDVKYTFAWSTMSQNAYSILGIASLSVLGVAGGVFYFASHILGKLIMFAVAGALVTQVGSRDIRQMGGLAARMPLTATLFILGALILSGVPPTSGFQAEWIMFTGIFTQGATGSAAYLAVAILGLVATMFTVAYTLWPMRRIFFGSLPSSLEAVKDAPLSMTVPLFAVALAAVLIGIYPDVVSKFLINFASGLPIGGKFFG